MKPPLLILRPEPGASVTAGAARAKGWETIVAPLFEIVPLAWRMPPGPFDALLLTSANAVRHGGTQVDALRDLDVVAVGEATAEAARAAGFGEVIAAGGTAEDAAGLLHAAGYARVLHLAGRDVRAVNEDGLSIERVAVYAAEEVAGTPPALDAAISRKPIALVHSARAGEALAKRVSDAARAQVSLAAISPRALDAAGNGWHASAIARAPDDAAMLEAAEEIAGRG